MSCEELKEHYELYALGVIEPDERREIEEHLAQRCPVCGPGVSQARRLAATLALTAPAVDPPARLRERVVASVAPAAERGGVMWLSRAWAALALVMLAVTVWYAYGARRLAVQLAALDRRVGEAEAENNILVARNRLLTNALTLVNLPDARQLVFGRSDREPPRGRVWMHPQRGVLLVASRLPAAPAGKIYEMWIVPKKGSPIPAGLFNSDERGEATHVWGESVNIADAAAVAVTLEPEGGVTAPTTQPVIVASL